MANPLKNDSIHLWMEQWLSMEFTLDEMDSTIEKSNNTRIMRDGISMFSTLKDYIMVFSEKRGIPLFTSFVPIRHAVVLPFTSTFLPGNCFVFNKHLPTDDSYHAHSVIKRLIYHYSHS